MIGDGRSNARSRTRAARKSPFTARSGQLFILGPRYRQPNEPIDPFVVINDVKASVGRPCGSIQFFPPPKRISRSVVVNPELESRGLS